MSSLKRKFGKFAKTNLGCVVIYSTLFAMVPLGGWGLHETLENDISETVTSAGDAQEQVYLERINNVLEQRSELSLLDKQVEAAVNGGEPEQVAHYTHAHATLLDELKTEGADIATDILSDDVLQEQDYRQLYLHHNKLVAQGLTDIQLPGVASEFDEARASINGQELKKVEKAQVVTDYLKQDFYSGGEQILMMLAFLFLTAINGGIVFADAMEGKRSMRHRIADRWEKSGPAQKGIRH